MKIAGDMCVYTNHNILLETIDPTSQVNNDSPAATKDGDEKSEEPTKE